MLQHACYAPRSRAQHLLLTSGPLSASLRLPKGLPVSSGVPENSAGCTIQLSGPFPSLAHGLLSPGALGPWRALVTSHIWAFQQR